MNSNHGCLNTEKMNQSKMKKKIKNIYLLLYFCNLSVNLSIIAGFRPLQHIYNKATDVVAFRRKCVHKHLFTGCSNNNRKC